MITGLPFHYNNYFKQDLSIFGQKKRLKNQTERKKTLNNNVSTLPLSPLANLLQGVINYCAIPKIENLQINQ